MVQLTEQIIKGKTRLDKLEDVKNLNLWGQDLDNVAVLAKLPNVEVLSLSVNKISSLKDFRHCSKLQELYLRKNEISDINEVQYLAGLQDLRCLWLCDNPCADNPNYRATVLRWLPQLQKLDNEDLVTGERDPAVRGPPAPSSPSARHHAPPPPGPPAPGYGVGSRGSPPNSAPEPVGIPNLTAVMHEPGRGGPPSRASKNILYAVMALLSELGDEDLIYVRREVDQRLGGR